MARGRGLTVDHAGFERCMTEQKERSRASASFALKSDALGWQTCGRAGTEFRGYERGQLHRTRAPLGAAARGEALVVLDRTPFYGESAGRWGTRASCAWTRSPSRCATRCARGRDPAPVGLVADAAERLSRPDAVWTATLDRERRAAIRRHHTATHLLQAALRRVLASTSRRPARGWRRTGFRFDFTHFAALTRSSGSRWSGSRTRRSSPTFRSRSATRPTTRRCGRASPPSSARSTMPTGCAGQDRGRLRGALRRPPMSRRPARSGAADPGRSRRSPPARAASRRSAG